jgi:hypothetical protein
VRLDCCPHLGWMPARLAASCWLSAQLLRLLLTTDNVRFLEAMRRFTAWAVVGVPPPLGVAALSLLVVSPPFPSAFPGPKSLMQDAATCVKGPLQCSPLGQRTYISTTTTYLRTQGLAGLALRTHR